MKGTQTDRARFGVFELDLKAGELHKAGQTVLLQEQPLQVLRMLVVRAGELVTREEIQKKLWPNDTVVEFDHGINTAIQKLRQALGDSADKPSYIQTVARRGYRLMVPVEPVDSSSGDRLAIEAASSGEDETTGQIKLESAALIGKTVSHYRVLQLIGGGGMGVVYKAEDLKLGRAVALKFLPEEVGNDPRALERFEREARTASALNHPNICTIYEIEEHDGQPFIVMELLEGQTLRDRLAAATSAAAPLSVDQVSNLALQISQGLEAAHGKGIIHRDIKPANIFITNHSVAKILDFGLAKLLEPGEKDERPAQPAPAMALPPASGAWSLTRTGAAMGTAGYMSPEQVRGENLDVRTDIFSFGLVLYEMAAGQRAFGGDTVATIHEAILNRAPAPLMQLHPEVLPRMEQIISRCLRKDRNQRYEHASDLRGDLEELRLESSAALRKDLAAVPPRTIQTGKLPVEPGSIVGRPAVARSRLLAAGTLVLILILAGLGYLHWRNPPSVDANASIVVLPFADLSPGKDEEYFSDGLTEQLINELARIPGLNVVARSSAFQFKGKTVDPRTLGRKLNVANILEGSVSREGNRLRIRAELTKAADGFQLWSESYDRQISDIFAVQDEIARAVARELQLKLTAANRAPLTTTAVTTPDVYEAYLEGRYFARRHQSGDMDKALAYADQATKLDPRYAPAWALRSQIFSELSQGGLIDNVEGYRKARESAQTAIALDPTLAEAYLALALIQRNYDWDWAGAEDNFAKATKIDPGNAAVYLYRAVLTARLGRFDEAIELEKKSIALDPEHLRGYRTLGATLYDAGRYAEAQAALQKAVELSPQSPLTHYYRGVVLLAQDRPDQALPEMQQEGFEPWRLPGEALAYYAAGRRRESDDALNALITKYQKGAAYQIAQVYAYRKENDEAFVWLERAYRQRDAALPDLKIDPLLKTLHQDPRYTELLNKMRL